MSTRTLRDKRPLQTASKVLLSDLTNLSNKVEHTKRWLEDAVNFYNLLKKVKVLQKLIELFFRRFWVTGIFCEWFAFDLTDQAPFPVLLSRVLKLSLKGHSQLAHMRIRYHFIANLHITETQSVLCLTKHDKNNILGRAKTLSKRGFSVSDWKSSKNTTMIEEEF